MTKPRAGSSVDPADVAALVAAERDRVLTLVENRASSMAAATVPQWGEFFTWLKGLRGDRRT